ncbi:MAG: proline--tRNA ligase [Proteobacteria bacterium]|nr:proline--tRNA ligase [Pseudomonadota bacterium]
MRASRLHLVTYREDPADAEVVSHRLMARAGLIFKMGSGMYAYSPLLWRAIRKATNIVRRELDASGCLELQLPILQDKSLWEETGRWEKYKAAGVMLSTTDRKGTTFGLAPTAEEVVTAFMRATTKSYKQLPVTVYQVHTKFRDEIRPRFGLLRVKEFLMMDAYSFDVDDAALDITYEELRKAYHRVFRGMGMEAFGVEADSGDFGGSGSMEFMIPASTGEDTILYEEASGYAANVEKATSQFAAPEGADEAPRDLHVEDTPNVRTCEELNGFFPDVPVHRMVKTLLYKAVHHDHEELWACLIRGDQQANEIKLRNHTGGLALEMLTDEEIRQHTGAKQGFAGPINMPEAFNIVADVTVEGMTNLLCGVNETDKHALDVNIGRDFPVPTFADFRTAREGEPGPSGEPLKLEKGIEAGHIFKLGTEYTAAMGATFMGQTGKPQPMVMGCYGIGVSRCVAAAVEQHSDDNGIVWPVPLAPFEAVVAVLKPKKAEMLAHGEAIYASLQAKGIEVMLDDRPLSPGAKFRDLELMGFPYVIVVGRDIDEGVVEFKVRATNETDKIAIDDAVSTVVERVTAERTGLLER